MRTHLEGLLKEDGREILDWSWAEGWILRRASKRLRLGETKDALPLHASGRSKAMR